MKNLVTIITPSYKSEKFISATMESVIKQTYKNFEMIIIDDASPDNANILIEQYAEYDYRIKLIKLKKNTGPAKARNIGIKNACGRYIAYLDADDLWKPEKLEKQINFMKKNNLVFTYSSYDLIDCDGKYFGTFITKKNVNYMSILKTNDIGCLTVIYDVEKLGKIYYMPLIRKRQDYGLWLNILKEIGPTKGMLESLATYRVLKNSVSSNKFTAAQFQWKIYREIEKISFLKSIYYFVHYAYFGILKYK